MQNLTHADPETKSPDFVAENIARLRALFPELLTEGKEGVAVNLDVLKQLVGDKTVTDAEEKYGLNWHGKRLARQIALTPSTGTLRPCPEESVDWDTTRNLMIEGDNLEVLKLLQKSYAGKVKLIYIDPPYNTGKDFVYPDNFQDNLRNYLELTGQVGERGQKLTSNTESSGRFHTDWLNMMYPRLKLARNLLRDDGVIFMSIDDSEMANLLAICSDVFGEENHIATFVWEKKRKASNLDNQVRSITEYLVCFRREMPVGMVAREDVAEENKPYPFYNTGNKRAVLRFPGGRVVTGMPDGVYSAGRYEDNKTHVVLENDVAIKDGVVTTPFRLEGEWRYSQSSLDKLIAAQERIELKGNKFKPYFINNGEREKFVRTLFTKATYGIGTNEDGNAEIASLFGDDIFSFPKPISLISKLTEIVGDKSAIVLDFFAGSGTSGHAVMEQNAADGGNRRYILVQLPEPVDPDNKDQKTAAEFCDKLSKPRNIAELTKERLRRAGKKIREDREAARVSREGAKARSGEGEKSADLFGGEESLRGFAASRESAALPDTGFRVFKLASSNIRAWEPNRDQLAETLEASVEHLKTDRTEQDILFELLLKLGLDLTVPMESRIFCHEPHEPHERGEKGKPGDSGFRVFRVFRGSPSAAPAGSHVVYSVGSGVLLVCLSPTITAEEVESLALGIVEWHKAQAPAGESTLVFRDSAFADDVAKTNLAAILQQHGLQNIRSL